IAAAVPADQVYESSNDRFTMNRLPRTDALVELLGDRAGDEPAQPVRDERVAGTHAKGEQQQPDGDASRGRRGKLPLEIRYRGAAPCNERSDPGKQQEEKAERDVDRVEEGRADRDLRAPHPLGKNRKHRSPEHGKPDTA